MNRFAIIISGSRRLGAQPHRDAIWAALSPYKFKNARHVVVLHGAQAGADEIADGYARKLAFDSVGIPYFDELDTPTQHPGGMARNRCVIDIGIVFLSTGLYEVDMYAFPDADSKGTWGAVRYAKSVGIEAEVARL